jgi:glycosyltransferase involved in cell wall biosynthesis
MSTICLNMIVKNESKTLPVLFATVREIIDYYVIVDTGSDDGTPELIEKIMDEYGIKGEIFHEKWVNFGVNRDQALQKAVGKADYAFIIDADEELNYTDKSWFKTLTKHCYYLKRLYGSVEYYLPGIVDIRDNNAAGWKWCAPVHNYLVAENIKSSFTKESVDTDILYIKSNPHGGAKSHNVTQEEKYLRDAKLLLEHHHKHPDDKRTVFYLGQSYRDAGKNEEAMKWYLKRVEMGGWPEEVYFAKYSYAICKLRTGKYDFETDILYDLLKAWNYRKIRLEALFTIVNTYRLNKKYKQAFAYGMLGFGLKKPNDLLFVHKSIHEYRFMDDLAIAAYWSGHYEISKILGEKILQDKLYPPEQEERLKKNLKYSLDKLSEIEKSKKKGIITV